MQLGMPVRLGLVVLDDLQGQLHHPVGEGNQHHGGEQIEHRLEIGDSAAVHRADPEVRPKYRQLFHHRHHNQEQHRADGIEGDVHHAGTLGVLGRADGANHGGGDAGAQIDAHDHGVGHGKGDAGAGHGGPEITLGLNSYHTIRADESGNLPVLSGERRDDNGGRSEM